MTMEEKQEYYRWSVGFMCMGFFMSAALASLLSQVGSVLAEPTAKQRRQKVEEYLSRKKTFSGVPIQENQEPISSRTRRATSSKLQDTIQISTSPKPGMENKENADKLSWDQSRGNSEKNVTLNSSTITLTNSLLGANYNPEDHASKDEVTEMKSRHLSLSKSFLQIKSRKEKQLIAEKQNTNVSLPKKPVLGTYRGKVIQSKINSFRKAPISEGEKSSLPNKKLLPSATEPAARSLLTSNSSVVLKTSKVTNNQRSVKPNGVLPSQSQLSGKGAINPQSSLKKLQPTSAVVPKKVTVQKSIGGRWGPQPLKATSNNSERRAQGAKKGADFCEDGRPGTPAKSISVVSSIKSGKDSETNCNRKSILPKMSAEERRARLDEWRASRGKAMRRPPISVVLGHQSKSENQEFSSGDSLEHVLHSEKVNKTLEECLQLTEQGCQGNEVCAVLEDLTQSIPGAKKLAKYWICCMRLAQMGPLEKLIALYEDAILAGAMPKDELRHTLIDMLKNTESLFKSEDGGTVIEAQLSERVEVSKESNSSVEQVQEAFKDLSFDDQKLKDDDKKAETSNELIKKEEMDLDLKVREEVLPKKNKKDKTKERMKKKGKREIEEQNEDGVKDAAQAVNSPEKENDTFYLMRSTTPYLESVKMHHEANDSSAKDLQIVTPLRYSQRIREKMCKQLDTAKDQDPCVSSFEQLGELESKATTLINKPSHSFKEISAEVEE